MTFSVARRPELSLERANSACLPTNILDTGLLDGLMMLGSLCTCSSLSVFGTNELPHEVCFEYGSVERLSQLTQTAQDLTPFRS